MMQSYLQRLPLIAILRGVTPDEVTEVGQELIAAGFTAIEVPLNSPQPVESIRKLAAAAGPEVLVGAGTVMSPEQVTEIAAAGGRLIVMPHSDPAVIRAAKSAGLYCAPGVATPTEGFAALAAGADVLKLFPAEHLGPAVLKAWRSVFPKETLFFPVGGITPGNMGEYVAVGAAGFGLGSALYKPGMAPQAVGAQARAFAEAWRRLRG